MDKNLIFGTVCDEKNFEYAKKLVKSFHYFHKDIPIVVFTNVERNKTQKELPEGTRITDITKHLKESGVDLFYKQKPYFANILFNDGWKAVCLADADQLVLGSLDYIFNHEDYDIGTVLNFNPLDFKTYGEITFKPLHMATEYQNAGFVMMRNHKLVKHWLNLCNSKFFRRMPYREQDLMNIIIHFGEYTHKCFDDADDLEKYYAWHGLLATHQGLKMIVRDKDIVLPKSDDGYPSQDVLVKVYHWAQGQGVEKMKYRIEFSEEVITRIDEILGIIKE